MGGQGCDRSAEPVEREDEGHQTQHQQHELGPVEPHALGCMGLADCHDADDAGDSEEQNEHTEHPAPADCSLTDTAHSRAKRRGNRADHVADAHQQAQT